MKSINFIKTLTRQQHIDFRRWQIWSVIVYTIVLCTVFIIHGLQVHHWYTLTQEQIQLTKQQNSVSIAQEKYAAAQKECEILSKKQAKIERVNHSLKTMQTTVVALINTCKIAHLESCKWDKKQVEITIGCTDIAQVTKCVAQLQKIAPLNTLQLVSLTNRENGAILATMKTQIVKKPDFLYTKKHS